MEVPDGLMWRVYYVDENNGTVITRDNRDFAVAELPTTHVICINQLIDNRTDSDRITGVDNYLWLTNMQLWTGSSDVGVGHRDQASTDYIRLLGIWAPYPLYREARALALTDPQFPNALDRDSLSDEGKAVLDANVTLELNKELDRRKLPRL